MEAPKNFENAEEAKKNKNLEKLRLLKLKQKEKKEKEKQKKEKKLKKLIESKENKKENDFKKISSDTKIPLNLIKNMATGNENFVSSTKMSFEEPKKPDSEQILCPGSDEEQEKKEKEQEKRVLAGFKKELNLEKFSSFLEKKRNKELLEESDEEKKTKIINKFNKKYKNFITRNREGIKFKYAGVPFKKQLSSFTHPKKIADEFFKNFLRKPEPLKEEIEEEEEEEEEAEAEEKEEEIEAEEPKKEDEEFDYEEEEEPEDPVERERYALFKKNPLAYNISLDYVQKIIELAMNPEKRKRREERKKRRKEKEEKIKEMKKERFKKVEMSNFNFNY